MKYKVNFSRAIYESSYCVIEADNNDLAEKQIQDILDDPMSLVWHRKPYAQINCSVNPEVGERFDILDDDF